MKVYYERKILGGFFLALSILTLLGVYSYRNSRDSMATSQVVSHTNEVLYHIEKLHSAHLKIEAELIRYSINADTSFIPFFKKNIDDATEHFMTLTDFTKDNPSHRLRLDSIRILGRKKVDFVNNVIQARLHSLDSVRKLIPSPYNTSLVTGINQVVEEMQRAEKELLHQRMAAHEVEVKKFTFTFTTLLIATGSIIIVLFLTINTTLRARLQAEEALRVASEEIKDLYNNAPCGYHSVDGTGTVVEMNRTWLEWIGSTREQVIGKLKFSDLLSQKSRDIYEDCFQTLKSQGSINNLECEITRKNADTFYCILNATAIVDADGNYIKSRSTVFDITDRHIAEQRLAEVNSELESFTYSVSHDLRAPLRSIDGYTKILQEDYGFKIEPEANRLLQIVRRNARRMGKLIDDLLDFARLGRKELAQTTVHMNSLVDHVRQELMAAEIGREIEFKIDSLYSVTGDLSMIRQVWINLISNALKYSHKQPLARIEIGCTKDNNHITYYIHDNGVGFDMKYVNKLFGVFQRLHKVEEFEGTGVGLALAHRIITRHGGKIWAEASVNKGATFYFFIPDNNLNNLSNV